jgi:hypothetical protein
MSSHPLTFGGSNIELNEYNFTDKELLLLADYKVETENATENQKKYFELISQVYQEPITNQDLDRRLLEIENMAKNEISDPDELLAIQIMASLLKNSDLYWNKNGKKGWLSVALADATNGASGALWGAVAGPLGSIVVGVNAAIIGSSSAYLIEQL